MAYIPLQLKHIFLTTFLTVGIHIFILLIQKDDFGYTHKVRKEDLARLIFPQKLYSFDILLTLFSLLSSPLNLLLLFATAVVPTL